MADVLKRRWMARRVSLRASGLLLAGLAWLVAGCGATTGAGNPATATPTPTCARALPNAAAINLQATGFIYPMAYPSGTVGGAVSGVISGTGLFTVSEFTACSPETTVSGAQSFYTAQLPALQHGWAAATTFPADGGLMTACAAPCFWDAKGGDVYYLVFDQFTDHGAGVVTYRVRWAAFDISTLPACGSNFGAANPGAQRMVYFIGGGDTAFPVPPLSSITPDDAAGGLRGYDICSPGDAASVNAFLTKEVPAAGWTPAPAGGSHCFYTANCWTKGGQVWSWNAATDPTLWMVANRQPLP